MSVIFINEQDSPGGLSLARCRMPLVIVIYCCLGAVVRAGDDPLAGAAKAHSPIRKTGFLASLNEQLPDYAFGFIDLDPGVELVLPAPASDADVHRARSIVAKLLRAELSSSSAADTRDFFEVRTTGRSPRGSVRRFHVDLAANALAVAMNLSADESSVMLRVALPEERRIAGNPFARVNDEQLVRVLQDLVRAPFEKLDEVHVYRGGVEHEFDGIHVYSGGVGLLLGPPSVRMSRPPEHYWFHNIGVLVVNAETQYVVFKFSIPFGSDSDPDIANRPSFARAVSQQRLRIGRGFFCFGEALPGKQLVPPDLIPESAKQALRDRWAVTIAEGALPASEAVVEWRAYRPPATAVATGAGENTRWITSEAAPTVAARWSADGRRIMTVGSSITIRIAGSDRVPFRNRPADLDADTRAWHDWQWLDRDSLHRILTAVLAAPFADMDDYIVRGSLNEAAGVRIFKGRIGWVRSARRTGEGEPRWHDELRLHVTDSDPQYIIIGVPLEVGRPRD